MRVLTAIFFMLLFTIAGSEKVSAQATVPPFYIFDAGIVSFNCYENAELTVVYRGKTGGVRFDGDSEIDLSLNVTDLNGKKVISVPISVSRDGFASLYIEPFDCNATSTQLKVNDTVTVDPVNVSHFRTKVHVSFKFRRDENSNAIRDSVAAYFVDGFIPPFNVDVTTMTVGTGGETRAAKGTVKWFNERKGYGFIAPSTGGDDIFR